MRVNIHETSDAPPVMTDVNLADCYPDDPDGLAVAEANLEASGEHMEGGGAMAVSYLRRAD